jgi:MFS family permease
MFRLIGDGLRYAVTEPAAAYTFILIAFIGTFGYNFNVTVPLLARFVLDASAAEFGLLTSALGLGALGAALAQTAAGPRSPNFMLLASAAFALFFSLTAVSEWYVVTAACLAATGAAGTLLMTSANTTLQLGAPPGMQGRVVSIYLLLMAGSTPIGGLLTGVLSEMVGVRATLGLEAAGCGLGVLAAMAYRRVHAASFALETGGSDEAAAVVPRPAK